MTKASPKITDETVRKATDILGEACVLGAGNASREELEAVVRKMLEEAAKA